MLTACANDEEGCLDANATNFDISADTACGNCCTFPNLSFSINHRVVLADTTKNMQLDSFYVNNIGQSFAIDDMKFFISNIALLKTDGAIVNIKDTIQLNTCTAGTASLAILTDDIAIIKRTAFNYTLGSINASGDFSGFQFDVGLSPNANAVVAAEAPSTHPLGLNTDSLYIDKENGYHFQKIRLATNEATPDVLTDYSIAGNDNRITLSYTVPFTLIKGFNTSISLDIDYLSVFKDIDFSSDSKPTIQQKIIQNTPSAIQLSN